MSRAAARGVNSSVASASPTALPRIWSRTSRALRADTRRKRARAVVIMLGLARGGGGGLLGLAVRLEGAGERELAELVADHVLGHVDGDELPAVVHGQRVADELRRDRGAPRPGLEHLLLARAVQLLDTPVELLVDVRPLLERASHASRLLFLPPRDDVGVAGPGAPPRLVALGRLAPRRHRVIALALALAAAHRVVDRVHDRAAHRRPEALPAHAAGLADRHVLVIEVADLPDGGHAVERDQPYLARGQPQRGPVALLGQELRLGAGAAAHL